MSRRYCRLGLVALKLLLTSTLAAQLAPESPLAALRGADLDARSARPLVEALAQQPLAVRLPGTDVVRAKVLDHWRRHDRAAAAAGAALGKAAAAAHKRQLGAHGARRVEQLRAELLAVSRGPDLTKERIRAELDPRLDELRPLLLPPLDHLLQRAPELATSLDELRRSRGDLIDWYDLYVVATADLELNDNAQRHFARAQAPPPPPPLAEVDHEITTAILLGLPMGGQDQRVLRLNEGLRRSTDGEEFAGTAALNQLRFLLGLSLLRIDPKLGEAARDHSRDMHELGFFAHESPVPGKRSPGDRAARFGTSGGAENIAAGHDTGAGAIRGWWYSPGHHRNMLGGHQRTGLGRQGRLWTQMFGG